MPVPVRRSLLLAGASALLTLLVYLASRRAGVNWLDERLLEALTWRLPRGSAIPENMNDIRTMYDIAPYTVLVGLLLGSVLWRRQPGLAVLAGAMLTGANLTTWMLQHRVGSARVVQILDEPQWMSYWPSGHTTAAVALGAAALLVSSRRWLPFTAIAAGALTVLGVVSNVVLRVHVPTDLLGGVGVAATWGFLALAAQQAWPARLSPR